MSRNSGGSPENRARTDGERLATGPNGRRSIGEWLTGRWFTGGTTTTGGPADTADSAGESVDAAERVGRRPQIVRPDDVAPVPNPIVTARGLTKVYGAGNTRVRALDGVDVELAHGELTAIMGPSGSGKSTLMHCLAGLDSPTEGSIVVDGVEISRMSQRQLTKLRRTRIGFVFQAYNLVPTLTAAENITLPMDIARRPVDRDRFETIVRTLELTDRLHHRPAELSGGQQQRVACARALIAAPSVVFADEPTGNLDSSAAAEVLGFLRTSVDRFGQSVVMVTHEPTAAAYAHRVLFLADGHLEAELRDPDADSILDALRELGTAREERRDLAPAAVPR